MELQASGSAWLQATRLDDFENDEKSVHFRLLLHRLVPAPPAFLLSQALTSRLCKGYVFFLFLFVVLKTPRNTNATKSVLPHLVPPQGSFAAHPQSLQKYPTPLRYSTPWPAALSAAMFLLFSSPELSAGTQGPFRTVPALRSTERRNALRGGN
jgi:hypothetical protein